MRDGRVSYEKARLIARHASDATVDSLIDRAGRMTCIELRRELEAKEEVQMCAKRVLDLVAPRRSSRFSLWHFGRRARPRAWLPPGECLRIIAAHFIEVWKPSWRRGIPRRSGSSRAIGASARSRAAAGRLRRSPHRVPLAGGSDEEGNLVGLCAAHHLHGVHLGYIRVSGKRPTDFAGNWRSAGGGAARRDRYGAYSHSPESVVVEVRRLRSVLQRYESQVPASGFWFTPRRSSRRHPGEDRIERRQLVCGQRTRVVPGIDLLQSALEDVLGKRLTGARRGLPCTGTSRAGGRSVIRSPVR